jgi:hypothetical protein
MGNVQAKGVAIDQAIKQEKDQAANGMFSEAKAAALKVLKYMRSTSTSFQVQSNRIRE